MNGFQRKVIARALRNEHLLTPEDIKFLKEIEERQTVTPEENSRINKIQQKVDLYV